MHLLEPLRRESRALLGDGKGRPLAAIAGCWGLLLGTRMAYPVLLPYLRPAFGLTLTTAGLLVTVLWLGSAAGQLPGGLLADRYSERLVMTVGTVGVAGAVVLLVAAPGPLVLFAATALVGLGQSLYPIARITLLSEVYPDRIGSALGVTMATGDLGQTVLPPVAGALAAAVAWQAGAGFTVPLLLLAGAVLWLVVPGGRPASGPTASVSAEVARALSELRRSEMAVATLVLFLYIFVWQSFTGLYPTYLVEEKGLSTATAGLLFSLFFACGVLVKPLAGSAYDRIGLRWALVAALVGPVAGFLLLPAVDGLPLLAAVTVLVSLMLGSGTITQSYFAESFAEEARGTGLGVIRTSTGILGATGPVVFGAIADRGFFDEGYVLLAAVLALVVLLTLRMSPG